MDDGKKYPWDHSGKEFFILLKEPIRGIGKEYTTKRAFISSDDGDGQFVFCVVWRPIPK